MAMTRNEDCKKIESEVRPMLPDGFEVLCRQDDQTETFFITFTTEFGPTYFVDYKSQLTASAWLPFTSVAGTGAPIMITDDGITNAARFFRIRVQ